MEDYVEENRNTQTNPKNNDEIIIEDEGGPESQTETTEMQEKSISNSVHKRDIDIRFAASIVLGIVIILLGVMLATKPVEADSIYIPSSYYAGSYSATRYTFGADFYTEIYGTSCDAVDELNDINRNLADGLLDINSSIALVTAYSIKAIFFSSGIITISIGIGVIALNLTKKKNDHVSIST